MVNLAGARLSGQVTPEMESTLRAQLAEAVAEIEAIQGRLIDAYALRDGHIVEAIEFYGWSQRTVAHLARVSQQRVNAILAAT